MYAYATLAIVALVSSTVYAINANTPPDLIGRWVVVKCVVLGEQQAEGELQVEVEFTSSQMFVRAIPRPGSQLESPPNLDVYDCSFSKMGGLLTLDLEEANNDRGEPSGIHVRAIYEIDGDNLWICSGHIGGKRPIAKRPTEFNSSKKNKSVLNVLKRITPN
jgi:uncharacterized protein (TIGR03067 family)